MRKHNYQICTTLLILIASMIIGCKIDSNFIDAEVTIIDAYRAVGTYGTYAKVSYQVKNISKKRIKGWNIYFRVSLKSGTQVRVHHGTTYDLEPGEKSDTLIAAGYIDDNNAKSKVLKASLTGIEAY